MFLDVSKNGSVEKKCWSEYKWKHSLKHEETKQWLHQKKKKRNSGERWGGWSFREGLLVVFEQWECVNNTPWLVVCWRATIKVTDARRCSKLSDSHITDPGLPTAGGREDHHVQISLYLALSEMSWCSWGELSAFCSSPAPVIWWLPSNAYCPNITQRKVSVKPLCPTLDHLLYVPVLLCPFTMLVGLKHISKSLQQNQRFLVKRKAPGAYITHNAT